MSFSFEEIVKYDIISQLMTVAIDEAAAEIRRNRHKAEVAEMFAQSDQRFEQAVAELHAEHERHVAEYFGHNDNNSNADIQRRRQPIFADYYRG